MTSAEEMGFCDNFLPFCEHRLLMASDVHVRHRILVLVQSHVGGIYWIIRKYPSCGVPFGMSAFKGAFGPLLTDGTRPKKGRKDLKHSLRRPAQ
jgi:hypothetical protein